MIHLVDSVNSTNTWLTHFNKDYFDSLLSFRQLEGYGRLGRQWESEFGGLYYSQVLPHRDILSIVVGVSVADILFGNAIDIKLKWPNDILVNGKKLGGIICQFQGGKVVMGLVININNKSSLATSISLSDLGCNIDKLSFINDLTNQIQLNMDRTNPEIIEQFMTYDCLMGKVVSWQEGKGIVEKISENGRLVVKDNNTNKLIFLTDEVHLE